MPPLNADAAPLNPSVGFPRRGTMEGLPLPWARENPSPDRDAAWLARAVGHDLNNILTAILCHTEMARAPAAPMAHPHLDEVLRAANRARNLVTQLREPSRFRPALRRRIALQPVVREAAELVRARAAQDVEIRVGIDSAAPEVLADEAQIHRAVVNLALNALQAMDASGGCLEIELAATVRAGNRGVRLVVADSGRGMDPETLERIFEPDFTTRTGGSGLGLAIVAQIVRQHEATIRVDSRPYEGSRFEILLPAVG